MKNIWLIGASSGLGLAMANQLATQSVNLFVSARRKQPLEALAMKDNVTAIVCDVANNESVDLAISQISEQVSHLDQIIFCAGVCHYVDVMNLDMAKVRQSFEVNVFAPIYVVNQCLELLQKAPNRPLVVPIASLSTKVPFPRAQAYAGSKAAMTYWFESMRIDCQSWLDITVVNPGFIETPMTAQNDFNMPGLMQPDEAATSLLRQLDKRPLLIEFPKRLAWPLSIGRFFSWFWTKKIGPTLVKQR